MKTRILIAGLLAVISIRAAIAADNLGVYLKRTEHSDTVISTASLSQGGDIAYLRLPTQSVSVSFWLKWDRGADNNSSGVGPVDRGNTPVVSFRQANHDTAWAVLKRDEILPKDELWHYHLITFHRSGSSVVASHYIDGVQSSPVVRNGSGITNDIVVSIGAEFGLPRGGTDEGTVQWRSTDENLILDDITVWSSTDQSVLDRFTDVADFGMGRFNLGDADILNYYDCNSARSAPTTGTANRVQESGSSPTTSWYNEDGVLPPEFHDASDPRRRKIQVNVTSAYGAASISPAPGVTIHPYDGTSQSFIEFTAPEYVYLDRYGRELGSSDSPDLETWLDQAFYRARNVGYAIRLGGRSDVTGTARSFAQPTTEDLDISWKWDLEYAVIIESSTSQFQDAGLSDALGNPALSEDGKSVPMTFGRNWVKPGTVVRASIDGVIFSDADATEQNVSFRSTGYFTDNAPTPGGAAADRYVVLSGDGDYLRCDTATSRFGTNHNFTLEFWARREGSRPGVAEAIVSLDSFWVGYDSDDQLRFGTSGTNLTTLAGVDLGTDWHHWAYQYDQASRTMSIFVDGVPIYRADADPGQWNFSEIKRMAIGATLDNLGNASNYFGGGVNNVRLWNKALTTAEIRNASQTREFGQNRANLVLELTFDQVLQASGATGASVPSTEGANLHFVLENFESLFPAGVTSEEMWSVVFPRHGRSMRAANSRVSTDAVVVNDWLRIDWSWQRTFRLQLEVSDGTFGTLPWIITEQGTYDGLDAMRSVWVPELSTVTVGTRYRTAERCYTLDPDIGVSGQQDAFRVITMESLVDGTFDGEVSRQFTFPAITGPGRLMFTYSPTIYRAEVAIGTGFDASSATVVANQLTPDLCDADARLAVGLNGGPSQVIAPNLPDGATSSGDLWVWDGVLNRFHPLAPGVFKLTWPDAAHPSLTYAIEITAAFPDETVTIANRENEDGTRQNPPTYLTPVTFPSVSETYPGSPGAHYTSVISRDAAQTPPVMLDANPEDRWLFERMPFAESVSMLIDSTSGRFTSTAEGRAVLLYSYRTNATEIANGDRNREAWLPRVISCVAMSSRTQPEAAMSLSDANRRVLWIDGTNGLYAAQQAGGGYFAAASDQPFTWESWVRLEEGDASESDRVIFQIEVRPFADLVQFGVRGGSRTNHPNVLYFSRENATNGVESFTFELPDVRLDDGWHHLAVTFDASALRVYRDGVLVGIYAGNPFPYTHKEVVDLGGGSDQQFFHTYGYSPQESGTWLKGGIDNLRFWSRRLRVDEVRGVMRSQLPTNTQANFSYTFDEGYTGNQIGRDTDQTYPAAGAILVVSTSGGASPNAADVLIADPADATPEVATRIRSRFDTAGFGSGYLVNELSNYNPHLYNRDFDVGEWGPVYPVNWSGLFQGDRRDLRVAYYENPSLAVEDDDTALHPDVAWPYIVLGYDNVTFPLYGPHKDKRIYIASRLGSEGVDENGTDQEVFDPAVYENLLVYAQPDATQAGYNPNEEHALIADSIKAQLVGDTSFDLGQQAVFALQNGLNRTNQNEPSLYTSEPWVLVEFDDRITGETEMAAYRVETTRAGSELFPAVDPETHLPVDSLGRPVSQPANPTYDFVYRTFAGDLVTAPYPVNLVVGSTVMTNDAGADSHRLSTGQYQRTLWYDKNGIPHVVSGDSEFVHRFWYPMRDDFWVEIPGVPSPNTGDPIAWVPEQGGFLSTQVPTPQPRTIVFETYWRTDYPVLKRGETMTYAGGENLMDHPLDQGLPGVVGWQSARLVFDSRTPSMMFRSLSDVERYSARVVRPLDEYTRPFGLEVLNSIRNAQGAPLTPASQDRVQVVGERWYFRELTGSLQKRFYFDSLAQELVFRGRLNDRESGAGDLTTTPIGLYLLEPNVLSHDDYESLIALGNGNQEWNEAVEGIYLASQNPTVVLVNGDNPATAEEPVYLSGISEGTSVQVTAELSNGAWRFQTNQFEGYVPLDSIGIGAAVVPDPSLLTEPVEAPLYVTLVENNHELASGAVTLYIVRIGEERFRGAIGVVEAQNVFDEKINLRHTADFGGNTGEAYYQWWVRDVAALDDVLLPGQETAWQLYQQGLGLNQIEFTGRPDVMLSDKLFYVRYGPREELDAIPGNNTTNGTVSAASWRLVDPNDISDDYSHEDGDPVPFQWAGAANSPQLQADGSMRFLPQLVMGWVKRVLDRINPYEARFSQTFSGDAPATFSSMIQEAGKPYIGPVALNSDKDYLERVGLIELYETVLARARSLTLDVPGAATQGTHQALLLAATRLAVLYEILASEAYADAQNSALPVRDGALALANPYVHAFQNQVASLLEEELALLRGTDFLKSYPVYNRLFWNYVKGLGEAAYNLNYNISDANQDGLIDESDAALLYPQGHGDAWGHYLSCSRMHYDLLRNPAFDWSAMPELYSLLDNVLPADYLDEKTFARIAAAKARTGTEIVRATYRAAYSADPDGQWQGYTDVADPARAWGVSEWAKRTGHGALFDWVIGNALVPDTSAEDAEDLDRIDRIANRLELGEIAAALAQVQATLDQANAGNHPLGLSDDALSFALDPFFDGAIWPRRTHFEQAYDSAVVAAQNALTALTFASEAEFQLRETAAAAGDLRIDALSQDLDYRARLIEIYGTPYEGTIGPGKLYEEGYNGPDTLLYMYIDRTDLEDLIPEQDPRYVNITAGLKSLSKQWSAIDSDLGPKLLDGKHKPENVNKLFEDFYVTRTWEEVELDTGEEADGTVISISAPVLETTTYAFQAPKDWGSRRAPGQIQMLLNQLVAAQHERDLAVEAYGEYVKDIAIQHRRLFLQLRRLKASAAVRDIAEDTLAALEGVEIVLEALEKHFDAVATQVWREANITASALPLVVGFFDNDAFAQLRAGIRQGGLVASGISETLELAVGLSAIGNKLAQEVTERLAEADGERIAEYGELLEMISEFGAELNDEDHVRRNIASSLQQMELLALQIRALEAEGLRLQNERAAFNMVLAGKAQRNRYQDMVTRLTRRDAVGRYQDAFDNALRFAWLAARAYDYDTSLSSGDPAAATTFLERIVRTRQLGSWKNGEPQLGNGGLADILAQLMANFQVLRGQIGISNPQNETGQLSLRTEHFRILADSGSDDRWRQALLGGRVEDLWQVPEFVHFCRPFAGREQGAQPGLVLEFATAIQPGQNVFGRPLAGGDNAYSTANFATKINSVGAWFEGYDATRLSGTPRVYLVPAGNDVLRIANSQEPQIRTWSVVEQRIPVPFLINSEHLSNPNFIPSVDSLQGSFAPVRRFSDFRAYYATDPQSISIQTLSKDQRLFGRSVWNTRWLLIIPGATLGVDPNASLDAFISSVTDIKLLFETYSNPGI